jgi:hypothetical protein
VGEPDKVANQGRPVTRPEDPAFERASVSEARLRAATRISTDYVLRSLQLVREVASDDLLDGIILSALVQANVGHLGPDAPGGQGAAPPDELRRPVSVMALAANLGFPYETMRRRIGKLTAAGWCERVPGGVIVPGAVLNGASNKAALRANFANLRRLRKALLAAGIDVD